MILIVSVALLDRLFLGPVLDKLKGIEEAIVQQEESIVRDLRFLYYKDKINNESELFEKYFTREVDDDDVVNAEFLRTIEKLATKSKVSLVKSNPSEIKKQKKYIEYYANLDCVGPLEDVINFMHEINSTDELLKVVQFHMTPKRGATHDVNVSMTIVKMIINPDMSLEVTTP